MFESPRRGGQARNFTTNAPKILDLKSSSEQIFSRKLPLGAPDKLVSYSGDNLTVLGTVKLPVKSKSDVYQEPTFHVLETHQPGLLGFDPHKTWA